ncbi:polysaccharide biosynthesis tyrosine autokinase [Mammaliicoccus stepanovicii]|uniref:non-specific protein-tyrosine kinase n=1 Tax=Mammaliicoccus stepanovicii TaxID=643214 RepID=A0A240A4D9_9STAP|nr:polysaccharide biosynthesis tyrosine autokinase [Mammaliicoccus stepanovicii]PNZ71887.1 capsular biosynthesis protein [Mammaliicoccus stepanovicii]GGI39515.1 capsular polysaccharide biosynthesis protein Cap5B [Mammaliicoccus stepanovicii]SNV78311.1 capsular polysaccharide synthesis protein [Mammaliicoccus stepanovicii]
MKRPKEYNKSPLITVDKPKSIISEKFKGIRTNIMFSASYKEIRMIVVASEKPASGKSTISANIAVTYAQAGYKTLIIDGDMRRPTQHYIFNKSNRDGLSNVIIKKSSLHEAVQQTDVDNLDVLTSGPIPPNPSELIGSESLYNVLNQAQADYDFVLIDSPPVNTVTDAQLFAEIAKNVVFVLDVEKNDRNEVKKGRVLLEKTGAKILGVVLNKAPKENATNNYYYEADSHD